VLSLFTGGRAVTFSRLSSIVPNERTNRGDDRGVGAGAPAPPPPPLLPFKINTADPAAETGDEKGRKREEKKIRMAF